MAIDRVDSTFKVGEVAATCLLFYHRYEGDMLEEQFHGEGVANMQGGHMYEVRLTHTEYNVLCCYLYVLFQFTSIVLHLYRLYNKEFSQIVL